MILENLPGQLVVLMLGWTFTVYLQTRSNSRAEALKSKEKIVDKLEAISKWVETEVGREVFQSSEVEAGYSGLLSQIELKITQFNSHAGSVIIDVAVLAELWSLEVRDQKDLNADLHYKVRYAAWNAAEKVEKVCNDQFFLRKGLLEVFKGYLSSYYGVMVGAAAILSWYLVARLILVWIPCC